MPRLKNSALNAQARQMIYAVFCYMKRTAELGLATVEIYKATAEATNTSISTVRRIVREGNDSEFITTGAKRPRVHSVTGIDSFDHGIIRRCIQNYHLANREIPTVHKLQQKLQTDINYEGSERSLRRIIKGLGFKWRKVGKNRKIMIESPHIRYQRVIYLETIKRHRNEGRPIIYMDELYIDSSESSPIASQIESTVKEKKKTQLKTQRIVILHAATTNGFLPNALLIFQVESKVGDPYDNINYDKYEKWLQTQLIPNLPHNSVLVVNNASYNYKEYDPAPPSTAKKSDMMEWLNEKGIQYEDNMLKPVLYNLIRLNKDRYKQFNIDLILIEHGHLVLRLPPCHPDLNPLKMAWADIKSYVSSKNLAWSFHNVTDLVKERMDLMENAGWGRAAGQKIREIEEQYQKNDHIVDKMTEDFVVCIYDSSSSDDDDNDDSDFEDDLATTSTLPVKKDDTPTRIAVPIKRDKTTTKSKVPKKKVKKSTKTTKVPIKIRKMPSPNHSSRESEIVPTTKKIIPIQLVRASNTSEFAVKRPAPTSSEVTIKIERMCTASEDSLTSEIPTPNAYSPKRERKSPIPESDSDVMKSYFNLWPI